MTRTATYLYPWDLIGDPAAASRVAALGVDEASVAATYHGVQALTPRHPRHRLIVARHAAAYYAPDPDRWRGHRLRPAPANWLADPDSFGRATAALRRAGLSVSAWMVLLHNSLLGSENLDMVVTNAYGDRYPWALCPAQAAVREYACTLVADVASRYPVDTIELEACGWLGFPHQGSHDKTGGVTLDSIDDLLMSLCFCTACLPTYADAGLDGVQIATRIRTALDATFAGNTGFRHDVALDSLDAVTALAYMLDTDTAASIQHQRRLLADQLRTEVVTAIRAESNASVLLHANADPLRAGSFAGVDMSRVASLVDGVVLSGSGKVDHTSAAVIAARPVANAGGRVCVNMPAVVGLNPAAADLHSRAEAAVAAGSTELRFYHAGLASMADLHAIRDVTTALQTIPWLPQNLPPNNVLPNDLATCSAHDEEN